MVSYNEYDLVWSDLVGWSFLTTVPVSQIYAIQGLFVETFATNQPDAKSDA
jgi:hypothetical protein